ncbi:MAG TPA: hypothetical protein VGR14_11880 [Verrucomicrobiae bacterium]|jgi:hypothetical protein|nr:hypothetical protein [Verrucomicrobiae bacterium]
MSKITARTIYIAMLRSRVNEIDSTSPEQRQTILWAELIEAGYLNGHTMLGEQGFPAGNVITGPTVKGRLFLQALEEEEQQRTLAAKTVKYGVPILTFIGGIATVLVTEFLKKRLGL